MATPSAHASPRTRWASLLAAPLVVGLVGSGLIVPPAAGAQETPVRVTPGQETPAQGSPVQASPAQTGPGQEDPARATPGNRVDSPSLSVPTSLPTGVRLDKVEWKTANRVALWVQSPAMEQAIQVQLMLPARWNA
ncbi:MAG: hypothetical protein U1C73_06785 [Dietzia sp.]|nr:hypothetical protein [Dietzia sp.]